MAFVECLSCKEKNNPSFSRCWKCGFILNEELAQQEALQPKKEPSIVVGFWKKYFADALDYFLLSALATICTLPFREFLYGIGESGGWVGILINFCYIGFLQTSIGRGQSLGKKILGIQVLSPDGSYMGLGRSFFRYSVLSFPFIASIVVSSLSPIFRGLATPLFSFLISVLVIALLAGIGLLVILHPLKKGLHDVLADTIVVRFGKWDAKAIEALNDPAKIKRAYKVCAAMALFFAIVFAVFFVWLSGRISFDDFSKIQREVAVKTKLRNVSIGFNLQRNNQENSFTLSAEGFLNKKDFDNETLRIQVENQAAQVLIENYTGKEKLTNVVVAVRTGYNLGITSFVIHDQALFDPQGNRISQATK